MYMSIPDVPSLIPSRSITLFPPPSLCSLSLHHSTSQQQSLRLPSSNVSAGSVSALAPLPPELRDLLRHRLGALEGQLLRKVAELEEEKSQLYNETAAHRQRTESALNSLLERITELERSM